MAHHLYDGARTACCVGDMLASSQSVVRAAVAGGVALRRANARLTAARADLASARADLAVTKARLALTKARLGIR